MAQSYDIDPVLLNSVEERNGRQKEVLHTKLCQALGEDLTGKVIAVWGLAFKPGTDDMREASSLVFLANAIERGATVKAFDPVSMDVAKRELPPVWFDDGKLQLVEKQENSLEGADALVLVTEWQQFRYPDVDLMMKAMRGNVVIDGRNQYDPKRMQDVGFEYYGIGRGKDSFSSVPAVRKVILESE